MEILAEPLSQIKPLADPLRIVTMVTVVSAGLVAIFGVALSSGWTGLGLACVLIGLALLIAPSGQPNAIYLRAFRTDKATAELRAEISAILGPDFRVAGIRPPRERTSTFLRFFLPGFFALNYAGSKFMELEAGDDWIARLWKTYHSARLVLIDVRDSTPYVHQECTLTLQTVGTSRSTFLVDQQKTEKEWRQLLEELLGTEWDSKELRLLDVSPERMRAHLLETDLKEIVQQLPAGAPGESEAGRQFVLEHVDEESLQRSELSPLAKVTAAGAVVLSASLGALAIGMRLLDSLVVVFLLVILALGFYAWLVVRGTIRSANRAVRLGRAGHGHAAGRAWFTLAVAVFLFLLGPVFTAIPSLERISAAKIDANEASAIASIKQINVGELIYSTNHSDLGFTVDLITLGGDQDIDGPLASGRKSGYTFSYNPGEKVNGAIRSYTITAVPDLVGTTGQRRFLSDESGEIHYNASGPADATSPLIH
jgi:hypothetical protein